MPSSIDEIRRRYQQAGLSEHDVPAAPIDLLNAWLDEAARAGVYLHDAMVLATATAAGLPSARAVMLRGVDDMGLVFYTNFHSRKARELEENPAASCLLLWPQLARQVRVSGATSKLADAESERYFATRERGGQLEAWASPQSETIPDREWLEARFRETDARFDDEPVARPEHWGGYRLRPEHFEFWQGREHRMHDRIQYRLTTGGGWLISRLAP